MKTTSSAILPLLLCAAAMLAGCAFSPRLGEGQIACGTDGSCPPSYFCGPDQHCYSYPILDGGSCVPATCPTGSCGMIGDGCGHVIDCGNSCPSDKPVCGGGGPNICGVNACQPLTQCGGTQNCGTIPDGCASTIRCGSCAPGQSCGGDGTPNHCCTPATVCPTGSECGQAPDGCGGPVTCGPVCSGQRVCGGGGVPNKCGPKGTTCIPKTCKELGKNCGTLSDGCAGVIPSCGTCAVGKTCVNNVCS